VLLDEVDAGVLDDELIVPPDAVEHHLRRLSVR